MIWTEASLQAPRSLAELAAPRFRKIAIANPEHAPYGRAALQALERSSALSAVQPKLVYGENVQQALQYAKTGNADAAIVALSLATSTPGGASLPIDAALHDPIDQALIVCNRGQARTAALRLSDLIGSPRGRAILLAHGFSLPGESSTGSIPAAPEAGAR